MRVVSRTEGAQQRQLRLGLGHGWPCCNQSAQRTHRAALHRKATQVTVPGFGEISRDGLGGGAGVGAYLAGTQRPSRLNLTQFFHVFSAEQLNCCQHMSHIGLLLGSCTWGFSPDSPRPKPEFSAKYYMRGK